jgi:rhomboid protease GluP
MPPSLLRRLPEAPVTLVFIAVNLLVFVAMVIGSRHVISFDSETLILAGAQVAGPMPGLQEPLTHWRWITAAFVHVGLLHIFMNMWVLAQIGVLSERALGRGLLAAAYILTGTIGNVVSATRADLRGIPLISAGASGAIMGLIGMAATFAWLSGQRPVAKALAFNILFVLGVGLSLSARGVSLVDNAAHIGGLIAGVILGVVRVRISRPAPPWLDRLLIGGSLAIAAVAFLIVRLKM